MPAEREQSRFVPGDEDLERGGAAAAHERDEAFVRLQAEQRRAGMQADSP